MVSLSNHARVEPSELRALVLALLGALGIALLAAATSPLVVGAALCALAVVALVLWRPWLGVFLFVGVVALLPFGVIPLPIGGAQLTFVDAVLLTTYASVLLRVAFNGMRLPIGVTGAALLGFVVVILAAFASASASVAPPPELVRRVAKLIASLMLFVIVRGLLVRDERRVQLVKWLMLAGAIQGALGSALMLLSPITQLNLLTSLRVIGYPTTDVLRYVPGPNDTFTTQLRAIGTSIDPNVFGGTLMLALALIVVQLVAPRPVFPRLALGLMAAATAAGMVLSLSRASWLGLAVALLLVGVLTYRRLLVLTALVALALLVTPVGQDVVERFVSGLSTADRATAFRVGEFSNALVLIQRYPLLGIGFGLSPDIDVTAGVSSVYLLVAEQTGLLGLAVYLVAVGSTWLAGLRALSGRLDIRQRGLVAALFAAVSGALVAGLLDHYFANYAFPHAVALFWVYAAALISAAD